MAWRAGRYNKYFDGFSERDVVTPEGKVKTERIYTGPYYREKVDDKVWKQRRIAIGVLYVLSVAVYFGCGVIDCPANSAWYVILCYGITFALIIVTTMNVYTKCTVERNMIAREFRSAGELYRRRVLWSSIGMLLTAAAVFLWMLIHTASGIFEGKAFICLLGYTFSGVVLYRLYWLEDQNVYQKIPNDIKLADPDEYVQITY